MEYNKFAYLRGTIWQILMKEANVYHWMGKNRHIYIMGYLALYWIKTLPLDIHNGSHGLNLQRYPVCPYFVDGDILSMAVRLS